MWFAYPMGREPRHTVRPIPEGDARGRCEAFTRSKSRFPTSQLMHRTKTGGAEKAQAGSVNGQWQSNNLKGREEKSLLVFKDDMFVLTLQGGMQLVSMNYKPSGAKGTGVFTRMSLQGKVSDISNPYEVSFRSTTPDKLVFDMVLKLPQKELSSYSECVPLETTCKPFKPRSPPGLLVRRRLGC